MAGPWNWNLMKISGDGIMIGNTSEDILILAIESSCDETAASVVKNGRTVLSNVISSQIATCHWQKENDSGQ